MDNSITDILRKIELAPYLQLATALIGKSRRIGGNQFRHVWATVGILIDYKIIDPVILKAAILHDLKEDAPNNYFPEQICAIDKDGARVVELVEELSIIGDEPKEIYLTRVMTNGSNEAKTIKLADRISNLIDIQLGVFDIGKVQRTLNETRIYILPYAKEINKDMYLEMTDLICKRTLYVQKTVELIANKVIGRIKELVKNIDEDTLKEITQHIEKILCYIQELSTINKNELQFRIDKDMFVFKEKIDAKFQEILKELSSDILLHNIYNNIY